jgi:hypothetical protein
MMGRSSIEPTVAQQIVGRERRERLSQLVWCGEGCFDSRRRVNSTVGPLTNLMFMHLKVNAGRGGLNNVDDQEFKISQAKKHIKLFLAPGDADVIISDADIPDFLVTDSMVERYFALEPPALRSIPDFDVIIDEIERDYVLGQFFSALSASVVTIERLLNTARMELHQHAAPKIKELWGKGALNEWQPNIDALHGWGYLSDGVAAELSQLFAVRCQYLHSGNIQGLEGDALRCARAAYALLKELIGFPDRLFRLGNEGIECINPEDPLFKVFYAPAIRG